MPRASIARRRDKRTQASEGIPSRPSGANKIARDRINRMKKRGELKWSRRVKRTHTEELDAPQMLMIPFNQEAYIESQEVSHGGLQRLLTTGAREGLLRRAQMDTIGEQIPLAKELDRLNEMLTVYEESLSGETILNDQQREENQALRRELKKELQNSFIRETYIDDLESEYARLEQLGITLNSRNDRLKSELQYMNQRVQELENDIDIMAENHHIKDSVYYNAFCEEIQQWKRLRDMMLSTDPKKTFWDLVHTYSNFMEQTLRLAEEAKKIFKARFLMAEYFASQQMIEMLESNKDGYPSYTKMLNYQPTSLRDWWQNRNSHQSESDSDSEDSQVDDDSGFKFFNTPKTTPQTKSSEFTSVGQFVKGRKESNLSYLEYDTDDDDDGYIDNTPNFEEPAFVHLGTVEDETDAESQVGSAQPAPANVHIREHEVHLQGFQQRECFPDEAILSRSQVSQGATIPRKRSKEGVSQIGLNDIEAGEPLIQLSRKYARRPDFGPYTRSGTMFKRSIIHEHLNREIRSNEVCLRARRQTRGHFPDRIVKAARRRSSRAISQTSGCALARSSVSLPNLEVRSLQQMINVRGSIAAQSSLGRDPDTILGDHTLLELIWIYCKKRPRDLIRPLVGIAILAAVVYLIQDYQTYQRIVTANTATDRMMQRMRIAQAEFQTADVYWNQGWKQWLDVDRVALQ